MYLCRVLTGEYTAGQKNIVAPPTKGSNSVDLYDSVVDNMNSPNMFIVFHDDYAYPEYLITFKWVLDNSNLGARLLWLGLHDYTIDAFASLLYPMFEFFWFGSLTNILLVFQSNNRTYIDMKECTMKECTIQMLPTRYM